jgi:arginyl-tRNA synthetase
LKEVDPEKRAFLLQVTALVRAQLVTTLGILGITAPEKM